jgi:hypothetical protein
MNKTHTATRGPASPTHGQISDAKIRSLARQFRRTWHFRPSQMEQQTRSLA